MFDLSARQNVQIGIDMHDFCVAVKEANVPMAAIRAVDEIESAGSGFLTGSKRPKILFEGHYFYRILKKLGLAERGRQIDRTVCYPTWTKAYYRGRDAEYARLASATEICHTLGVSDALALRSASWGRYQIMGDNFRNAGFDSVENYVEAMFTDEGLHLRCFAEYIENTFLDDELRAMPSAPLKYAALFARSYNGSGYKRNNYHIKIANAFAKFNRQTIDCATILANEGHVVAFMPGVRVENPAADGFDNTALDNRYLNRVLHLDSIGEDVTLLQERLINFTFMMPGSASRVFDQNTVDAVKAFQSANGLVSDGVVGQKTWSKLFGV